MALADSCLSLAKRSMLGARDTFKVESDRAYSVDPVFIGLRRNRVNAELLKAALRIGFHGQEVGYSRDFCDKLVANILASQKQDGCWHEIHPSYDQPSALATSFIAEALLDYSKVAPSRALDDACDRARDYVLASEQRPGFFLKSARYRADHLNVDASCGAFLAKYSTVRGDGKSHSAALRAASHIAREQLSDGSFPYTTADEGPPYPHPLHLDCIHYQGVTGYYLSKIHQATQAEETTRALTRGARWLADVQRPNGRFDWSRSKMMFAYQLTGAYAFAVAYFAYASRWEPSFLTNAGRALAILDENVPRLANRWEASRMHLLPRDLVDAGKSARWTQASTRHELARLGYGFYRQLARQRRAKVAKAGMFNFLNKAFSLNASTIEPSANYPDLFMTAEVADCLTFAWTELSGGVSDAGHRSER